MINFDFLTKNTKEQEKIKLHINEPSFINKCTSFINLKLDKIKHTNRPVITVCIGTDRSTGDSLGPLVGWLLQRKLPANNFIYGTIDKPVHAANLLEVINELELTFRNPYIIAVDACLGKLESVGCVNIAEGSLKPGAAVNKNLPAIGDLSISGIVNVGGFMEYYVLQNTRLSLVMQMAEKIASVLYKVYQKR